MFKQDTLGRILLDWPHCLLDLSYLSPGRRTWGRRGGGAAMNKYARGDSGCVVIEHRTDGVAGAKATWPGFFRRVGKYLRASRSSVARPSGHVRSSPRRLGASAHRALPRHRTRRAYVGETESGAGRRLRDGGRPRPPRNSAYWGGSCSLTRLNRSLDIC